MDLLGRKLGIKKGTVFKNLLQEIYERVARAESIDALSDLASKTKAAANRLQETAMHIGKTAASLDCKVAYAFATPFLEVMGDVIMAWMHLWRAQAAYPKLEKLFGKADDKEKRKNIIRKNKEAAFYDGQIKTASYYINAMLPATLGKMDAIQNEDRAVIEIDEKSFGG
jgi:hypothetical protein